MNFEDAKKEIVLMAEEVRLGKFNEDRLTAFVLSFRMDLWHVKSPEELHKPSVPRFCMTCSCGPEPTSCDDCGDGYYTKFDFSEQGRVLGYTKVTKQ